MKYSMKYCLLRDFKLLSGVGSETNNMGCFLVDATYTFVNRKQLLIIFHKVIILFGYQYSFEMNVKLLLYVLVGLFSS